MLRARLATAGVAIPLLLVLIFWGPPAAFAAVVCLLAVIAMAEFVQLAFPAAPRDRAVGWTLGTIVVLAAATGPSLDVLAALVLTTTLGLLWVTFGRRDFERGLMDLGLIFIGVLYAGLLLPHFIWLHQADNGPRWVTFVIVIAMCGDTGGYFVGRAFGRHRLIPRLSPGKTVEGALGIIVCSVIGAALVKPVLLARRGWAEVLGLALIMAILGQFGDLSESAMKRTFGAKESGWIFPGHGGVLDRIDSLLFPVALVYYYLGWVR